MKRLDVALVSCVTLPEPDPDAAPLSTALAEAGISAEVLGWDDDAVDWSRARLTVLRSSWNYARHAERFLAWADRVARLSTLWNPLSVVRWNLHKHYLLELAARGIPVTPTVLISRGSRSSLAEILLGRGWNVAVVKPAVSAASYRTLRVGPENRGAGEAHFRALVADGDVLVQEYLPSVEDHGERALVWVDGELTHAVRKSPRFAGEDESVSDAVPVAPPEAALARRILDTVTEPLLYARVDLAPGPTGYPALMELELIEPSLFFPQFPPALERFVAGIRRRLENRP